MLTAFSVLSTPLAAQAAPGDPFDVTRAQVFVAQEAPTRLYKAVTDSAGSVSFQTEGPVSAVGYNAIAYNTVDNYLYGTVLNNPTAAFPAGALIRIGQDGVLTRVGAQVYGTSLVGAFGPNNRYYKTGAGNTLQAVNVTTGAVMSTVPLSGPVGSDFAYKDGFFWALNGSAILRTNPTTGVVTSFPFTNPQDGAAGLAGAAWTFGNGNLGFSSNAPGTVTQIAITNPASANPTFTVVSQTSGPGSSNNDGAASPGLPTDLEITKTAPAAFAPGGQITYNLTVTNNGAGVSSGYTVSDELPVGMTDIATTTPGCSISGRTVTCVGGELEIDATTTIEITAKTPAGATACLTNTASVLANEVDPDTDNNTASAESCPRLLEVTKTSDATAATRVGDTVTYTVTATNAGESDYTAAVPAILLDDLSGVLDDATYNNDAATTIGGTSAGAPAHAAPLLSWSGPLAAGESVELSYTVTLTAGGDGAVRNIAFGAPCDPADSDCDIDTTPTCVGGVNPDTGMACAVESFELPRLEINKGASTTELPASGQVVTYTVTATNVGPGDYTAAEPALVIDDLTGVLDAATFDESTLSVDVATGDLGYDSPRISWSGPLASGDSVTFTYEVTYTGMGDRELVNVAFGPKTPGDPTPVCRVTGAGGIDPVTGLPCDRVQIPGASLTFSKSVDPASGTAVKTGDVLTYTLTFDNDGSVAAEVAHMDYLAGVLDDAELLTVDGGGLSADTSFSNRLWITGEVPAGERAIVTYTMRVLPADQRGDHELNNFLQNGLDEEPNPGQRCNITTTTCTRNPVTELVMTKSVDPATGTSVKAGDELTYTLTFQNLGGASADVESVDDLTHVLDDAQITTDAVSSDPDALTVWALDGDRLPITGSIGAGETVTVTYTVTVGADGERGDNELGNFLLAPGDETPEVPGCSLTSETCTYNPIPEIVDSKTVDPASGTTVNAGDELTYTLTFENVGAASGPVDKVDDLTHVLDDAEVTTAPAASDPALTVSAIANDRFSVTGGLAKGQKVTVTYTVTVGAAADRGDDVLGNYLIGPDDVVPPLPLCVDGAEDCTINPVSEITSVKSVDPASGTEVRAGQELTYTLTFKNSGAATGTVDQVDDLSHVLDDAAVTTAPVSSDPDTLAVSAISNDRFSITGDLPADTTVTVTYTVTVAEHGDRGDSVLGNFLLDPDEDVPLTPVCADDSVDCTLNPVSEYIDSKSVDPASGGVVATGDELAYTLTFTNVGGVPVDVERVDDLTHLLDDATITTAPSASNAALSVSAIASNRFTVSGELAVGQTVTVTYVATVSADVDRGDHVMANFLLDPDEDVPLIPVCADDAEDCTINRAAEVTSVKSVDPASGTEVTAGQELTYTLTFKNTGAATGAIDQVDDLTHVLDDAAVTTAPVSSAPATLAVSAIGADDRFSITGDLPADTTVTVTYTVTVAEHGDRGDSVLGNFLLGPDDDVPATPVCAAGSVDCTVNPVSEYVDSKSVDPASGGVVATGDELTYTLKFTNVGGVPVDVERVDDLTHLLDDATITTAPSASNPALDVTAIAGNRFTVSGELAVGQTVTVTYVATVNGHSKRGDSIMANFLLDPDEDVPLIPVCADDSEDCTINRAAKITVAKSVSPMSGTPVTAGQELTYTLTFKNEGAATGAVDAVDDLTHVLDDATVIVDPVASDAALTVDASEANRLKIKGDLEAGQTVTVTYTVKVKAATKQGDHKIANFVLHPGAETPKDPTCEVGSSHCTANPVGEIVATKTSDPASGTEVKDGQEVKYTLTFTNTGAGAADVAYSDDLSDVLDDARIVQDPRTSSAALDVAQIKDGVLDVTGKLSAGETATVTYSVEVDAKKGDGLVANFLLAKDQKPVGECDEASDTCTVHPVETELPDHPGEEKLPDTGGPVSPWALVGALLLLITGLGVTMAARRRSE